MSGYGCSATVLLFLLHHWLKHLIETEKQKLDLAISYGWWGDAAAAGTLLYFSSEGLLEVIFCEIEFIIK